MSRFAAECGSCRGLCCVALAFSVSRDFPVDKAAGRPCQHLQVDHRCAIHDRLRPAGYRGCTVYDCLGAGQRITRMPVEASTMYALLPVLRQLHELLIYLDEVLALAPSAAAVTARRTVAELAAGPPETILALDLAEQRAAVNPLLLQASATLRSGLAGRDLRGADLLGATMRGAQLRGADLRGALLVAADLRDADLRRADLIGADLRDADLRGTDLTGALFVLAPQIAAALGDAGTRLSQGLARPSHWVALPG